MDIEFCPIGEKMEKVKEILAFPEIDDDSWIVSYISELLGVSRGQQPVEEACPDPEMSDMVSAIKEHVNLHDKATTEGMSLLEEHIKEAMRLEFDELDARLHKIKVSLLRGMHSGDTVGKILVALIDKVHELEDTYIWKCPECGAECVWDAEQAGDGGTPMCTISQVEGDEEDEDDNGYGCDMDMVPDRFALFDTDEWKNAESIVLRIKRAKENK